jgi:hypothetical protein
MYVEYLYTDSFYVKKFNVRYITKFIQRVSSDKIMSEPKRLTDKDSPTSESEFYNKIAT